VIVDLVLMAAERMFRWLWHRPGEGPEADRRARLEAEVLRANERLASLDPDGRQRGSKEGAR
jgi:hypothetical protein